MVFRNFVNNLNQDSISSQHLELNQYQTFDKLASYYFSEIELEHESDTDSQFCDSVSIFESILTLISLPNLTTFLSQQIPIPINL